jgi:exodeoxyribonuclease VII large subunit
MAAEIAVREKNKLIQELNDLRERTVFGLKRLVEFYAKDISRIQSELGRFIRIKLDSSILELRALSGKLDALSPLNVLERGYSITYKLPIMTVIKESKELKTGDKVSVRFYKGKARCLVEDTED